MRQIDEAYKQFQDVVPIVIESNASG